jgi:hypothetical protein
MRLQFFALTLLASTLLLASCSKGPRGGRMISAPPAVGALYSLSDGEGGYRVAKIVAMDEEDVVFINLFANRWTKPPALSEARKAATPAPLAYSAQTFAGMQPMRLENGTATPEEIQAYETWKQGKRELF